LKEDLEVFIDPLCHLNTVFLCGGEVPFPKVGGAFATVEMEDPRNVTEVGPQEGGFISVGFLGHGVIHFCNALAGNCNVAIICSGRRELFLIILGCCI
jgi:hypothetical protein